MLDRIDQAAAAYCKLLEALLVALLAAMVLMVFGNVVLRYAFNSGLTVSEELSRWAFVWMIFLGAIVAIRDNAHLGTNLLVGRLGATGKKLCLALAETLMIGCALLVLHGSWTQTVINAEVEAPVSGWPMAMLTASGLVFAVSAVALHAVKLVRLSLGRLADSELVTVQESEDLAHLSTETDALVAGQERRP